MKRMLAAVLIPLIGTFTLWAAAEPSTNDPRTIDTATPVLRHPRGSRFYTGIALGQATSTTAEGAAGTRHEGGDLNGGLQLGFDQRIFDAFSFGSRLGFMSWDSRLSGELDYVRSAGVIALEPRLMPLMPVISRPHTELYLALPIGITFPAVNAPKHRAFQETAEGSGWLVGLGAGATFLGNHWGGYVELTYTRYAHSINYTYTDAATGQHTSDRVDYTTHVLLFGTGVVFAL